MLDRDYLWTFGLNKFLVWLNSIQWPEIPVRPASSSSVCFLFLVYITCSTSYSQYADDDTRCGCKITQCIVWTETELIAKISTVICITLREHEWYFM